MNAPYQISSHKRGQQPWYDFHEDSSRWHLHLVTSHLTPSYEHNPVIHFDLFQLRSTTHDHVFVIDRIDIKVQTYYFFEELWIWYPTAISQDFLKRDDSAFDCLSKSELATLKTNRILQQSAAYSNQIMKTQTGAISQHTTTEKLIHVLLMYCIYVTRTSFGFNSRATPMFNQTLVLARNI